MSKIEFDERFVWAPVYNGIDPDIEWVPLWRDRHSPEIADVRDLPGEGRVVDRRADLLKRRYG